MKYIILFSLLLVLIGCSNPKIQNNKINPQILPFLSEFSIASKGKYNLNNLSEIPIILVEYKDAHVNPETYTVGTCHIGLFDRYITINKAWWNDYFTTYYSKKNVIFHELGHCLLLREHTIKPKKNENFWSWDGISNWFERFLFDIGIYKLKGYLKDGCPASIMHPTIVDNECWQKHSNYYQEELFNIGLKYEFK